jgi:hypothetical protein
MLIVSSVCNEKKNAADKSIISFSFLNLIQLLTVRLLYKKNLLITDH